MNWQNVKMKQVINFIPSQAERSRSLTRLTTGISTERDGPVELGSARSDRPYSTKLITT